MAKKKKQRQNSQPSLPFGAPLANPPMLDIQKIKQDAVNEALRILEPQLKLANEERERIRKEAYDKALDDAMRYLIVCGSKALNNKYRFAYIRLERYIDELMRLVEEGDIEEMTQWLEKIGFKLTLTKEEKEANSESN